MRLLRDRKKSNRPYLSDRKQDEALFSICEEGIKAAMRAQGLENTPENFVAVKRRICEDLEQGNATSYGKVKAKEQHKALQKTIRAEKFYFIKRDGGEEVLHAAEEAGGSLYKSRGVWKIRSEAADASGKIINDTLDEEFSPAVREINPEEKMLQQSALSNLTEQERIWLFDYESRGKKKGFPRTTTDRQRASRLRKRVREANKGLVTNL